MSTLSYLYCIILLIAFREISSILGDPDRSKKSGMLCTYNLGMRGPPARDDYQHTTCIGSHKFHKEELDWNSARKVCIEEGGHLAIVNSLAEKQILMDLFNRSGPGNPEDMAFLGIHDLYAEGDWVTVLGDPLAKTGYTEWTHRWGGQPDNGGGWQHCGAFLREGGMDDTGCKSSYPFFCELPGIIIL